MVQEARKIDFINIDCESNYFDTKEQIRLKQSNFFVETTSASRLSGSNTVTGLLSRKRIIKDDRVYNSDSYLTSSTVLDPSGNQRKILAASNDYLVSSSIDSYRNGVEITQEKHWTAGVAKITAGSPGHLYESLRFGYSDIDILSPDVYHELEVFNPVTFVESGGGLLYPIITSNSSEAENSVMNGIIEPFAIRPVISYSSIYFPFEPHSTKAEFGNGNTNLKFASDQVLSVDYYLPQRENKCLYLDAVDLIGLPDESGGGVIVGPSSGYLSEGSNVVPFFEDVFYARGEKPSATYSADLIDALKDMPQGGTTYITSKERSATCGFVYDQATQGTDSIAYGGYTRSASRKQNRSISKLRDESSFISEGTEFNDLKTVNCSLQNIEYPSMIPSSFLSSSITVISKSVADLCSPGGIRVERTIRPALFDSSLKDSIILTERLMNS
jgi:hypothetical protein